MHRCTHLATAGLFALLLLGLSACGAAQTAYVTVGPHDAPVEEGPEEREARRHFEAFLAVLEAHVASPAEAVAALEAWVAAEGEVLRSNLAALEAALSAADPNTRRALEARMSERMAPLWDRYLLLRNQLVRDHGTAGQRVLEVAERLLTDSR